MIVALVTSIQHIEVDRGGVVHDVGVMLAGENIAGAAHVGGKLIDLVKTAIDHMPHEIRIAQVADHEVVGLRLRVLVRT